MTSKKKVNGIAKDALQLILEMGRSSHPHEFAALLRADEGVISEVVLVPGTVSDDTHALMFLHNMPIDPSVVGSVHSHPVRDLRFSDADLEMFGTKGAYNIIVAYPYTERDWVCYNPRGERVILPVVEVSASD